jgi:hypothetical protein
VVRSLLVYYKSDQARQLVLDDADSTLDNTNYYGEKKHFTFETYMSQMLEAYHFQKLYKENLNPMKQVMMFIHNIEHLGMNTLATPLLYSC